MKKNRWIFLSIVLTIVFSFTTNPVYQHMFDKLHLHYGMVSMIICHLGDASMIVSVIYGVFTLKKEEANWKSFMVIMTTALVVLFMLLQWMFEPNHHDASANDIGSILFILVLYSVIPVCLSKAMMIVFIEAKENEKKKQRHQELTLVLGNEKINDAVKGLNEVAAFVERKTFQSIKKKMVHYEEAINAFESLNDERKNQYKEELKEMESILIAELSQLKKDTEEYKEAEIEQHIKQFYEKA